MHCDGADILMALGVVQYLEPVYFLHQLSPGRSHLSSCCLIGFPFVMPNSSLPFRMVALPFLCAVRFF